ncbi:MAG: HNH endonuclease [Waterburya sp.]
MPAFKDLTGEKFERLTVIKLHGWKIRNNGNRKSIWECECECGKITYVLAEQLKSKNTRSCGCLNSFITAERNRKNRKHFIKIGDQFNRLTVLKLLENNKLMVECSCSKIFNVCCSDLVSGHTKSCGCYKRDMFEGSFNHKWNPCITEDERYNRRECPENNKWRFAVYNKYNKTCQRCGYKGKKAEAHHILPWALFPELRFDINNGICLCQTCHNDFHTIFGNNCNREQINAFISVKLNRKYWKLFVDYTNWQYQQILNSEI